MITPAYEHDGAIDLFAAVANDKKVGAACLTRIPAGIAVAIPNGFVGLIVPRSSTGIRGLHLANAVGVIDASYRGEIFMNMTSAFTSCMEIEPMQKICQMVVVPHYTYSKITFVEDLDKTTRGNKGFGSSGK